MLICQQRWVSEGGRHACPVECEAYSTGGIQEMAVPC
jgi:hypothetical protein